MPRTVEESRATAERANSYVKQFNLASDTHERFSSLAPAQQRSINDMISSTRKQVDALSPEISLGFNHSVDNFEARVALSQKHNVGNCGENALLALDYVANNEPDAHAESYSLSIDHAICVVDRDKDSDPTKPATWGENAFVVDPHQDTVYPAKELSEPKSYTFSKYRPTEDNPGRFVAEKVDFDPNKDTLEPSFNTDTIRKTHSEEHIDGIVDAYKAKSELVLNALETFHNDLSEIAKKVDKENDPISQQKSALINRKIESTKKAIQSTQQKVTEIQQDKLTNPPNRADYKEIKSKLESQLQQSVDTAYKLTSLSPQEQSVLGQSKNPGLDKILKTFKPDPRPELVKQFHQANAKSRDTLGKLPMVKPKPYSPAPKNTSSPAVDSSPPPTNTQASSPEVGMSAPADTQTPQSIKTKSSESVSLEEKQNVTEAQNKETTVNESKENEEKPRTDPTPKPGADPYA